MQKSLDRKLAAIHADPNCREFILADAKDADMALGLGAPGQSPELHAGEVRFKTLEEYRNQMRLITKQALVDIMLMSASSNYALTFGERLFDDSAVTPAIRANDTTDIHLARGASYAAEAARPFRTASLDHAMCGHLDCKPEERSLGANLGLYSVTFNNDLRRDLETLERFHAFREEAERKGFRYFLEVFDPNVATGIAPDVLPHYLNDMITRMLAGVAPAGRPVFLKIVYHGPKAMEELVRFDRHLVVGILGGSSGTTRDAFQLLHDAQKYGAKVALFGRKINHAENQLAFVQFLRLIVEGVISPVDAVKAYHAVLGKLGVAPIRPLETDLQITEQSMSYAGGKTVTVPPMPSPSPVPAPSIVGAKPSTNGYHGVNGSANGNGRLVGSRPLVTESRPSRENENGVPTFAEKPDGRPDFTRMSPTDRLAYHRARLGLGR
ncbi:hypothetical protein [Paludisphaera rhizosphaerae]|uniref:hypothetical protein n=1 Tax=Paludisphaera rhizosphaerae TaxID=2711216 RepID=UPI0013EB3DEE|nr:hypothetical protein [Paludisphaera rhizosphaerae]